MPSKIRARNSGQLPSPPPGAFPLSPFCGGRCRGATEGGARPDTQARSQSFFQTPSAGACPCEARGHLLSPQSGERGKTGELQTSSGAGTCPLVTRHVTIHSVRRFRNRDAERLFQGRQVRRLPPDIQRRARMRLQRVVAATVLNDLRVAALASPRIAQRRQSRRAQHPDQRPMASLLPLDQAWRHGNRSRRLPLRTRS